VDSGTSILHFGSAPAEFLHAFDVLALDGHLPQPPRIKDHFLLTFGYERANYDLPTGRLHAMLRFLRLCLLCVEGSGQAERHAPEY
jgi:hypothetical protein